MLFCNMFVHYDKNNIKIVHLHYVICQLQYPDPNGMYFQLGNFKL